MPAIMTNPKAFAFFKKRWEDHVSVNDWSDIDHEIIPLLLAMNKLYGVRTVYSCSSHPGAAQVNQLHVIMAFGPPGLESMVRLQERLHTELRFPNGYNPTAVPFATICDFNLQIKHLTQFSEMITDSSDPFWTALYWTVDTRRNKFTVNDRDNTLDLMLKHVNIEIEYQKKNLSVG